MAISVHGINIQIKEEGSARAVRDLQRLWSVVKQGGGSFKDLEEYLERVKQKLSTVTVNPTQLQKSFKDLDTAFSQLKGKVSKDKNAEFLQWFKQGAATFLSFKQAVFPIKRLTAFHEAIAKLNFELRMLSYSSGIGETALASFGAAASIFGGSAKTVSSYAEKYLTTIANAKRGAGFGWLQENYRKFGVEFNFEESPQEYFERAVRRGRQLKSQEERILFAKDVGQERWQEMLGRMNLTEKQDLEIQRYMKKTSEYKDANGESRKGAASRAALELNIEMKKMEANWTALKDQMFVALAPAIITVVQAITKFVENLNKMPSLMNAISIVMASLMSFFSFALLFKSIGNLSKLFGFMRGGISLGGGLLGGAKTAKNAFSAVSVARMLGGFKGTIFTFLRVPLFKMIMFLGRIISLMTPWGLAIAAISAMVAAIFHFKNKGKQAEKYEEEHKYDAQNKSRDIVAAAFAVRAEQLRRLQSHGENADPEWVKRIKDIQEKNRKQLEKWGLDAGSIEAAGSAYADKLGFSQDQQIKLEVKRPIHNSSSNNDDHSVTNINVAFPDRGTDENNRVVKGLYSDVRKTGAFVQNGVT